MRLLREWRLPPSPWARGASWYRELGTKESPGTKTLSVAGAIGKTGLVEVPLGMPMETLREALGAVDGARAVKAYQIGGPSGVILPAGMDFQLDFEGLAQVGGSIGSGGIVFLDDRDCVVDVVRYLTEFSRQESCGQCQACKKGLARGSELLSQITRGESNYDALDELRACAEGLERGSLCGLGRMAARPILSSLRFFEDEYRAHLDLMCPGTVCKRLVRFTVIESKCPGCRCCKPTCPTNAVNGKFGKPYTIDERLCIRCWMRTATCPYDAIKVHASAVP